MKKIIFISKYLLFSLSLCRILQIWQFKNFSLKGSLIEFGAFSNIKKNFSYHLKPKKDLKIYFSNIVGNYNLFFKIDLEKKNNIKKKFDNVLIFNVLEHIQDLSFSLKELNKILNKNGKIIGSTPFIYRVHGAPKDCYRYTSHTLERELKKQFKNVQIIELGYGPVTAALSIISDYTKLVPFLNNILILLALAFDEFLNIFTRTDLKKIYPIAIFFVAKKK
jgi:SAM-dependent methyltransferase